MEVILLERIERLGQMGDVVVVKDGFARNFLLPKNKALRANKENLEFFEKEKINLEAKNLKLKNEAEAVSEKIVVNNYIIIRQASDTGQLYGSVNSGDVKEKLQEDLCNSKKHPLGKRADLIDKGLRVCCEKSNKDYYVAKKKNIGKEVMFILVDPDGNRQEPITSKQLFQGYRLD